VAGAKQVSRENRRNAGSAEAALVVRANADAMGGLVRMDPTDKPWGDEFHLISDFYRHATACPTAVLPARSRGFASAKAGRFNAGSLVGPVHLDSQVKPESDDFI
jgi:hypothetical protein